MILTSHAFYHISWRTHVHERALKVHHNLSQDVQNAHVTAHACHCMSHTLPVLLIFFALAHAQTTAPSDGTVEHKRAPRVDPMAIFVEAMENLKPLIGVAGIKKGGATYKVTETPTLLPLHPTHRI
jgi:hypothetical protein